jgi:hypothetical protein
VIAITKQKIPPLNIIVNLRLDRTCPDGHQAISFPYSHKLAVAAGHTSLVRRLTALRRSSPAEECAGTLLRVHTQKQPLRAVLLWTRQDLNPLPPQCK